MNGTMPATVNSSDGSGEISEALGTTVCPRWAKCSRNRRRISAVCMVRSTQFCGAGRVSGARPGRGSGIGVMRAAPDGQLDLVAGRQRRVQPGARAQLGLTFGRGRTDVGAEVT